MSPLDPAAWHEIAVQPVTGVTETIVAYAAAVRLHRWGRGHPLLNPTLVAIVLLAAAVQASGLSYAAYAQSASVVSFMLSPAVVLLAVPLYRRRAVIRASGSIILGALAAGLPTGIASAVGMSVLERGGNAFDRGRPRVAARRRPQDAAFIGAQIRDRRHCDRDL